MIGHTDRYHDGPFIADVESLQIVAKGFLLPTSKILGFYAIRNWNSILTWDFRMFYDNV